MAAGDQKKISIILTGFGPFMDIKVNPSWKVVKEAEKLLSGNLNMDILCARELVVGYADVSKSVKDIHQEFKPDLAIHVGVAQGYKHVTLECQSVRSGYAIPDVGGQLPPKCEAVDFVDVELDQCLSSSINTEEIAQHCSEKLAGKVSFALSKDPGLYLCGFCYYTSLYYNRSSLFVHIPDENDPFSIKDMAAALVAVIECAVEQVSKR